MGQVVPGVDVDDLSVGTEVELVVDVLYEDDDNEYLVWKWRPAADADRETPVPDDRRSPSSGWACTPGASGAATSSSTA